MNKLFSTFAAFLIVTFFTVAQESGEKELGNWYEITTSNRISDKISISGSITNWNYEFSTNNRQLLLGLLGVNYHLSKKVRVGLMVGRAEIDTNFGDVDLPLIQENRILEQIIIKLNPKKIAWIHRFKLEHRFFEIADESKLIHRVRYLFKGNSPINDQFSLVVYDEIHFNLNEFDFQQNRAYAGILYKLNNSMNFELGYVRHSFKTRSFNRIAFKLNLVSDFRKKKVKS